MRVLGISFGYFVVVVVSAIAIHRHAFVDGFSSSSKGAGSTNDEPDRPRSGERWSRSSGGVTKSDGCLSEANVQLMIDDMTRNHDVQLDKLRKAFDTELSRVNDHFQKMLSDMHKAEKRFDMNLKRIEDSVGTRVGKIQADQETAKRSWILPFAFLMLALAALFGFFTRLYRKATKGSHFL